MTDGALVKRYLNGETQAFNTLVWRYEKPLYNFILRNMGNEDTARDLCQTAFIRMFRQLKRLRDPEKFAPWMYRIALNLCRDEFKKKKNKKFFYLDENPGDHSANTMTNIADENTPSPEDLCHQEQITEILKRSLLGLPEEQRVVIIMKQYQGLKFTEIADILETPVNTVKSRLYSGLRGLRQILEESRFNKEVLFHEM